MAAASSSSSASVAPATRAEDLEELECAVCTELPLVGHVCQCPNGHLMCSACSDKILAKAATSACPVCRVSLTKANLGRNLFAEHQLARARIPCEACKHVVQASQLSQHTKTECTHRPTACTLKLFGCPWVGIAQQQDQHKAVCVARKDQ